ncbi:MAG: imidazoleglycerol-phosphate dehydratase [Candidatus Krumholzibacteriia bacterium]
MSARTVDLRRTTAETDVTLRLDPDGSGRTAVATGLGFLDHMLTALARHAGWDLELACRGDLQVDDHHTAEDCALLLGRALDTVRGRGPALGRFGWARVPMDEALAEAAVDLSGRPWAAVDLGLVRASVGDVAAENLVHVLTTLAMEGRFNLHVDVVRGRNDHHRAEAAFKAVALALRQALAPVAGPVRSTKEVLG